MATSQKHAASTITATGASISVWGRRVDIKVYGTWVGTVAVQVMAQDGTTAVTPSNAQASITANDFFTWESACQHEVRLYFTRTSGTVSYELNAAND